MAVGSAIEWTEATWNPTTGCTKISSGCKNCYAATMSKRLKAMGVYKYRNEFEFTEQPDDVELPLKWKKGKKIFVNSMSDLFHEQARMEFIAKCVDVMSKADWHQYQVLTKRSKIMSEFADLFYRYFGYFIPAHIWMGVSVENADHVSRIDDLRETKCNTRFISFEPLIGPVGKIDLTNIDWAIIGGESGYGFRPVRKEWILEIIEQCKKQNVAVFFKQWGGIRPKSGGRDLDGKTYDEYPIIADTYNPLKNIGFDEKSFQEFVSKTVLQKKQIQTITAS
jgi:protein gp37